MDSGYYTGVLDGDYGGGTERAVRAFQTAYQLPETGVIAGETWTALGVESIVDAVEDTFGPGDGVQDAWPTAEQFVALCLAQAGDAYVYGENVDLDDPDPSVFDCAELVEWAVAQLGLRQHLDSRWDWSQGQRAAIEQAGFSRTVEAARSIRGALLFNSKHVAVSLGDGTQTIEAKGKDYGVGIFTIDNPKTGHCRFDGAGLVPGLVYAEGS
jgi:peptidoglycan hydrolase-like protein with peptidoglycan-binding domain